MSLKVPQILSIYKRLHTGTPAQQLARENGVSDNYVYMIGNGRRCSSVTGHQRQPLAGKLARHADEIVSLYEQHHSTYELADRFDCEACSIRMLLKRRGVRLRTYSHAVKLSRARRIPHRAKR